MPFDAMQKKSSSTTNTDAQTGDPNRDWTSVMRNLPREHGFEQLRIEGELPAGLQGTLYRNGAMQVAPFGDVYSHWFEGDGGVVAVRFGDGRAEGAAALVQTDGLLEERAAGGLRYGWSAPLWSRISKAWTGKIKNAANTNVLPWQGRLFALMEVGKPYELDPDTLQTIGETDLGGAVVGPFSAHPHRVDALDTVFNIGVRYGVTSHLDFYAWHAQRPARRISTVALRFPTMIHDFVATENHLVALISPVKINVWRALAMMRPAHKTFAWRPDLGMEVVVVPLDDPANVTRFEADPFWVWHFGNGFSTDDGTIRFDLCRYDNFDSMQGVGDLIHAGNDATTRPTNPRGDYKGRYAQCRIDLSAKTMTTTDVGEVYGEFARVNPRVEGRAHRYVWMCQGDAGDFADERIIKVDSQTGDAIASQSRPGCWPSEPVFVPRPGATAEDDGWLLTLVYDPVIDTSHVAVLDAADPSREALARCHFDHHVPMTFHGNFLAAR